jgi:hypothetical protein
MEHGRGAWKMRQEIEQTVRNDEIKTNRARISDVVATSLIMMNWRETNPEALRANSSSWT